MKLGTLSTKRPYATMKRTMEVTLLSDNSLKIKGKKASLVVDPTPKMPKTSADVIVLLDPKSDTSRVEEYRLVVGDSGEYEVGGLKITGENKASGIYYGLSVDNAQIILAKVSTLEKFSDASNEAEIAVLNVDSDLNESLIASLEAKAVILYGEKAKEGLKALGKNDLTATKKFSPAKEATDASETQIVWLA